MNNPETPAELLPCPFCGDPLSISISEMATHINQGDCIIGALGIPTDSPKAVTSWSTRAQPGYTVKPLEFVENRNGYWSAADGYQVAYTHKDLFRVRHHGKVICKDIKGYYRAVKWANDHNAARIAAQITPTPDTRANPEGFTDQLKQICEKRCAEVGDPACWKLPDMTEPCEHITPCSECMTGVVTDTREAALREAMKKCEIERSELVKQGLNQTALGAIYAQRRIAKLLNKEPTTISLKELRQDALDAIEQADNRAMCIFCTMLTN